jgi:hypothetical protein
VFLDQLLRQSVLTHWLVQRRRDHRASLGMPVGALDPVERMFSKSYGSRPAPASAGSDSVTDPAAADDGRDGGAGRTGPRRGFSGLRQLPLRWTVHMDAAEAAQMGLLTETHSRAVGIRIYEALRTALMANMHRGTPHSLIGDILARTSLSAPALC